MLVDSGVVPLEHTVEVEFLGRRLRAAKGAAWLAERTGAALLPTAMFQRAHGRHTVIIAPEAAAHGADAEERVRSATAAVFRVLESHVRREPAQWLKWKDLPAFYSPEAQPDV
jgi:lauroyl/myristoyl acyltransferase